MKKKILAINLTLVLLGLSLTVLISSCLKKSDADLVPGAAIPFKGDDLVKTLSAQSSLHLFNLAFNRLGLAASVTPDKGFTIFAPTDSAMKAAGLDEAGINNLNIDSLRKLITYHVGIGSLDDRALSNSVITPQISTLKQDPVKDPSTGAVYFKAPDLFVKESGAIYFNGKPIAKSAPAIQATNGYVYPISGLISSDLSGPTLYDIIQTDPDLSLYNEALTIQDSILVANGYFFSGTITLFSKPGTPYISKEMYPTILAPTNKAFNDAGFHSAEDIRKYANNAPYIGYDQNTYVTFYYSPLDSVLNHHVLYSPYGNSDNGNQNGIGTYASRIYYYDLLGQAINNGTYNTWGKTLQGFSTYYSLNFQTPLILSAEGQTAYVKWNSDPKMPKIGIPRDASVQHPVNNYIASNGALFKIDKLFYPAVK